MKSSRLLADGGTSSYRAETASVDVIQIGGGGFVGTFTASFLLGHGGTSILTGSANAPPCEAPFEPLRRAWREPSGGRPRDVEMPRRVAPSSRRRTVAPSPRA